jgi:hypothetical protein
MSITINESQREMLSILISREIEELKEELQNDPMGRAAASRAKGIETLQDLLKQMGLV